MKSISRRTECFAPRYLIEPECAVPLSRDVRWEVTGTNIKLCYDKLEGGTEKHRDRAEIQVACAELL